MRSLWFAGQDLDRKPPRVCRGRAHPGWPQQKVLLTMLWAAPRPRGLAALIAGACCWLPRRLLRSSDSRSGTVYSTDKDLL